MKNIGSNGRVVVCLAVILMMILGACTPAEMVRRTAGTSIQALEEAEEGRYAGIVEAGVEDSYDVLYAVLSDLGVYIYQGSPRRGYLVAMRFDRILPRCGETTRVGFFFREKGPGATRLEVVSLNPELARSVAELVFGKIDQREGIAMRSQGD